MTDAVLISTKQSQPARMGRLFGSRYATIFVQYQGNWVEIPVALGGVRPHSSYGQRYVMYLQDVIPSGTELQVIGSNTGMGALGELSIVELMLPDGTQLSRVAIQQGWAVPDERIGHIWKDTFTRDLTLARVQKNGLWGDPAFMDGADAGVAVDILAVTAPKDAPLPSIFSYGWLVVIPILILMGIRERHYKRIRQDRRLSEAPRSKKGLVKAGMFWFGRNYLGFVDGMFRPYRSAAPDTSAAHDRDQSDSSHPVKGL